MKSDAAKSCEACKHSRLLTGLWVKLGEKFVQCRIVDTDGAMKVTARANECVYQPSKWESKA